MTNAQNSDTDPKASEPAAAAGDEPTNEGGAEAKYTDADVDAIMKKRLAREREKMEREIREAIAKEADGKRGEAEKLAGMTELQRAQHEARRLKAEKEALEAERDLSRQMAIARKELSEANIPMPDELLSMFVSPEAEKTGAAIGKLKDLMPKFINEAVQRELKRTPPTDPGRGGGKSFGASFAERYNERVNGGR